MAAGYAPIGTDGLQINLHHVIGSEPGPMIELMTTTHQRLHRPLHSIVIRGRSFRRNSRLLSGYEDFRKAYWESRSADF
jgi:hypothetical protein